MIALEDEDLLESVHRFVPRGVQFVLDCVGGSTGSDAIRTLDRGGRMLCYGTLSPDPITLPPRDIMMPMATIEGFYLAEYLANRSLFQRIGLVRTTAKLIASGELATSVEQVYGLEALHDALAHALQPGRTGKILIRLAR